MVPHCCHFLPGYISGKWDTARQFGFVPPGNYNFENILEDCNATGIKYLGIAIMMPEERESLNDYRQFAEQVNLVAEKSKNAGINCIITTILLNLNLMEMPFLCRKC